MYSSQGFGFDMLRNQGSYPWSIPNEKDKNKSIMLQSSSATSTTKKKQPTQSKSQSQPKKTASKELWETTESVTRPQTSSYDEVQKRSQDRMQRFGIGTSWQTQTPMLRQRRPYNSSGREMTPAEESAFLEGLNSIYGEEPKPQKKAPLEVQGELSPKVAEGIRRPGIEQLLGQTPKAPAMTRKTSAIDPDAEELTFDGEAAFLEGLASAGGYEIPQRKPGDMLRFSMDNAPWKREEQPRRKYYYDAEGYFGERKQMPDYAQTAINHARQKPAGSFLKQGIEVIGNEGYKQPYIGTDRHTELYGSNAREGLDTVSNALAMASLVPVVDTYADLAAIPVDLMRGDYTSAALDALGVIPFAGEVADTAKLARMGVKATDVVRTADDVFDLARLGIKGGKAVEDASDGAKTAKFIYDAEKIGSTADAYHAAKVDGTIEWMLKASEEPIGEMHKLSGSIAKTSPMQIPEGAKITPQVKKGYYHMQYEWTDADGYYYKARWHTRNPTAPLEQRDVWVIERGVKGIGYGKNRRQGFSEILVAPNMWIDQYIWEDALSGRKTGNISKELEDILEYGHWKA